MEEMEPKTKNGNKRQALDVALKFLAIKPRSVREMENYLASKGYDQSEIAEAVQRLCELDYLNDSEYAHEFVRTRLNARPVSKRKLKAQLYQKRVPESAIDEALEDISAQQELENAIKLARKFFAQSSGLPQDKAASRITNKLLSRGFEFSTIKTCLKTVMEYELLPDDQADGD